MDFAEAQKPKMLMTASVASMIDLFNMNNIEILQSMGYEVHVAANFQAGNITSRERVSEFKEKLISLGIKVFDIPIPRNLSAVGSIIKSCRMFQKIYAENHYKLIHCHSPIGGVLARLCARKIRKKDGAKLIYTAHGFHFYKGAPLSCWLLYYPIERLCSIFTDLLITINQEDFLFAKKHLRSKDTVYVQGVGVDLLKFSEKSSPEKLRAELGIPNDALSAITVGELNKNKNQKTIIKAIHKNNSDIHYILAGFGREEQRLYKLSKKFGIAERVHFLGYRNDISALFCCVDLFCFPSFREGLSLSLMEAMTSGLPILCSDIRGNRDLIVDGKGGFLCPPRDVLAFAERLKILNNDPALRESFGAFNAERAKFFSSDAVRTKMREIYKKI